MKLQDLGFKPSKADVSLFYFNKGGVIIFLLIYVEDIIVASSSAKATSALLRDLKAEFAMKDLGDLHYFLGIEVKKIGSGILLMQEKYTSDLLNRVGMIYCKPINTPMSSTEKLSIHDGEQLGATDATQYRSIVRTLQYLTRKAALSLTRSTPVLLQQLEQRSRAPRTEPPEHGRFRGSASSLAFR